MITKEQIREQIGQLRQAEQQALAQANAAYGGARALESVLATMEADETGKEPKTDVTSES